MSDDTTKIFGKKPPPDILVKSAVEKTIEMGITPSEFIDQLKVYYIHHIYSNHSQNVSKIAMVSGYQKDDVNRIIHSSKFRELLKNASSDQ